MPFRPHRLRGAISSHMLGGKEVDLSPEKGKMMAENEKAPNNEPQQLNDEDLDQVSGGGRQTGPGFTAAWWNQYDEDSLQADFAAHGAGMSLDEFIKARGISAEELTCRRQWLQSQRPLFSDF